MRVGGISEYTSHTLIGSAVADSSGRFHKAFDCDIRQYRSLAFYAGNNKFYIINNTPQLMNYIYNNHIGGSDRVYVGCELHMLIASNSKADIDIYADTPYANKTGYFYGFN